MVKKLIIPQYNKERMKGFLRNIGVFNGGGNSSLKSGGGEYLWGLLITEARCRSITPLTLIILLVPAVFSRLFARCGDKCLEDVTITARYSSSNRFYHPGKVYNYWSLARILSKKEEFQNPSRDAIQRLMQISLRNTLRVKIVFNLLLGTSLDEELSMPKFHLEDNGTLFYYLIWMFHL